MHHLFISPHMDDAVASCGGTIAKLGEAGGRVTIFNLFSGDAGPPYTPFTIKLHKIWGAPEDAVQMRRAEDRSAAAVLNAAVHFEDVADSLYRTDAGGNWLYVGEQEIFGPRHRDDEWLIPFFFGRITAYVGAEPTRIYAPLGVGAHVDHLLAFDLGVRLRRDGRELLFYEDLPYSSDVNDYQRRVASLSAWTTTLVRFSERHLAAKLEAFGRYKSQIPMLFECEANMRDLFTEYARQVVNQENAAGERYWVCPEGASDMTGRTPQTGGARP